MSGLQIASKKKQPADTMLDWYQLSTMAVDAVRTLVRRLTAPSTSPLLPFIPKYREFVRAVGSWRSRWRAPTLRSPRSRLDLQHVSRRLLTHQPPTVKVLFLLLILANSSSFPFLWHLRVWKYPLTAYYKAYTKGVNAFWRGWRKDVEKRGNIYQNRTKIKRIALFDDCDYNMHLSNSSYPKASDAGKMKWAIDNMAPCFATGLFMALGASHWQYFKEIPIGSTYTIETRLGGYGDKW